MYSACQYQYSDLPRTAAFGALVCVAMVCAALARNYHALPRVGEKAARPEMTVSGDLRNSADLDTINWSVFHGVRNQNASSAGSAAARFRVAGMFFTYADASCKGEPAAIIEDIQEHEQVITTEGETIDDFQVVRIQRDSVVIGRGGYEETLWLSFAGRSGEQKAGTAQAAATGGADATASGGLRFGKRVGEHSWVFSRDRLVEYYKELLDSPDRLVTVFDSLKPVYDANRSITGYRLEVEGEPEFFKSVGLKEGDTIRSVNSMQMTSRRRAEYLIREFSDNRLNAFLLDVERDGKPERFLYRVR